MLAMRSLRTLTRIDTPDLKASLLRLSAGTWKPAVIESERVLAQLAGADEDIVPQLGGALEGARQERDGRGLLLGGLGPGIRHALRQGAQGHGAPSNRRPG